MRGSIGRLSGAGLLDAYLVYLTVLLQDAGHYVASWLIPHNPIRPGSISGRSANAARASRTIRVR